MSIQIIGKGGFAREVVSYLSVKESYLIMGEYDEIKNFRPLVRTVIAIGDPKVREKLAQLDFEWDIVDFSSTWSTSTKIGKGSIICPGTILTVDITIGEHVIINLNCTVGHDSTIGDFTTISPGVNISGNVHIGKRCYIGTNAVIREGISICNDVIIGAGGVVVKNILEPGVYVGNPCKKIK